MVNNTLADRSSMRAPKFSSRCTDSVRCDDDTVLVTGRRFPSSKTCSECGEAKSKLSLSEHEYGTGSSPGIGRGGAGKTSSLFGEVALAGEASMARKGLGGCKAGTT